MSPREQLTVGLLLSAALLLAPLWTSELGPLEAVAGVAYAWSVGLLARNSPLGWWIGLAGCALYGEVYRRSGLVLETGLMGVYFVTTLQALVLWLRGGAPGKERPVTRIRWPWLLVTAPVFAAGYVGLRALSERLGGAMPPWDALVTTLSLVGHVWLMFRFVEAWPVWIAVDTVAVPLYLARSLWITAALYAIFWVMAASGWRTFTREVQGKAP